MRLGSPGLPDRSSGSPGGGSFQLMWGGGNYRTTSGLGSNRICPSRLGGKDIGGVVGARSTGLCSGSAPAYRGGEIFRPASGTGRRSTTGIAGGPRIAHGSVSCGRSRRKPMLRGGSTGVWWVWIPRSAVPIDTRPEFVTACPGCWGAGAARPNIAPMGRLAVHGVSRRRFIRRVTETAAHWPC